VIFFYEFRQERREIMKKNFVNCEVIFICIIGCSLIFNGCENGNGDSHDFGTNDQNICVALGDSITAGKGASTSYPAILSGLTGKTVINEGTSGAISEDGAAQVGGELSSHDPGYLLILLGANDIIRSVNIEDTIVNLRNIIAAAKNNKTVPIIATVTPMYFGYDVFAGAVNSLNTRIKQLADEQGCDLVDLAGAFGTNSGLMQSDGLHPNDEGLNVIARSFAGAL
jgi:lysophospholipase L1-like esterase